MSDIVISGTGLYTPPYVVTNEELVASYNSYVHEHNKTAAEPLPESSAEFILKASGIKQRYVMEREGVLDPKRMQPNLPERGDDEPSLTCEMAVAAAQQACAQAGIQSGEIDAVLCACSNMERPYPAMAVEIQSALGAGGFGFDMNVACSSATFGLQTAVDTVKSGHAKRVLVVNPELCSAHLNFRNRDSHFIFGDVCTAAIVEHVESCQARQAFAVINTRLKTQFSNHIRNNFGFLSRLHPGTMLGDDKLFCQEGRKVFKEVVPLAAQFIQEQLASMNLTPNDIRRYWLHQANINMNQLIARKILGADPDKEKAPVILDEFANTASAGSVIAFHRYRDDLVSGDIGLICSFGAGYSIGGILVKAL